MANALLPSLPPAVLGLPPALPTFPLRPLPCLPPAFLTAVTRHRMLRSKSLPTSFQQTLPASWLSRSPPVRSSFVWQLLSSSSWRILTGAHGRARSRKAQVSEGIALLSEAPSSRSVGIQELTAGKTLSALQDWRHLCRRQLLAARPLVVRRT